jgi:beta-lactamase regulating signal transducer with metallopeptidase domain/outer membrane protein assembly factor BamD (BamD/ComL family)
MKNWTSWRNWRASDGKGATKMETILKVLGESSVRAIVIAFTTACVLWGMRVKSPGICHRAWTGVLVAMLCLPFFSIWVPRIAVPVLPASTILAAQEPPSLAAVTESAAPDLLPLQKPSTQYRITNRTASRMSIYYITGILYLAGFCVLAFRLMAGTLLSHRLVRGASQGCRILYSPKCTVPMTIGLFRARVFLPAESKDWDPGKLDAVLTHEKEHMRRRDPLVEWLALLNRTLYWFNPLAWWLCRKLSSLAEQACDETVLARGHDSGVYAGHLLEFARSVKRRGILVTKWGSYLHGSTLAHRIRRILNSGASQAISPARLALVTALWSAAALTTLFLELSPVQAAPPRTSAMVFPSPVIAATQNQASYPTTPITRSVVPPDNILYETGMEYFQQRQFQKARLAFQTLISTHSNSSLVAPAFLAIANSYYKEGGAASLRKAEEQYKDFVVFFPRDPKADDARMKVIFINIERMRSENAEAHYRGNLLRTRAVIEKFIDSFNESDYRPIVEEMLHDINRELANQRVSNITGYVVNEAGKPIKGVSISAVEKAVAGVQPAPVGNASSDGQGYFTLPGMPLDNEMEIHFAGESLAPLVYERSGLFRSPLRITMRELSIERIEIKGNRRISEDTIRFYIQSKPGELYSPTKLASDVRSLYVSNFFENVEVQERDGDSGKIIAFTVDEKLLIRSIQYVGNSSLTESEILEAYKENKVGLIADSQFEYRKVVLAERILKKLLAERGKPQASIRVETESFPPSSILLHFIINEGN